MSKRVNLSSSWSITVNSGHINTHRKNRKMNKRSPILKGYNGFGHAELAVPQKLIFSRFLLVTVFNREKVVVHD